MQDIKPEVWVLKVARGGVEDNYGVYAEYETAEDIAERLVSTGAYEEYDICGFEVE